MREYWIVAPGDQDISVFVRDDTTGRYRLAGEYSGAGSVPCATLPGLQLSWEDIFSDAQR